jgi:hypothetical protein
MRLNRNSLYSRFSLNDFKLISAAREVEKGFRLSILVDLTISLANEYYKFMWIDVKVVNSSNAFENSERSDILLFSKFKFRCFNCLIIAKDLENSLIFFIFVSLN